MKFSIKDFFSKCDQIHSFLTLLEKSLMENFIFCAVSDKTGICVLIKKSCKNATKFSSDLGNLHYDLLI